MLRRFSCPPASRTTMRARTFGRRSHTGTGLAYRFSLSLGRPQGYVPTDIIKRRGDGPPGEGTADEGILAATRRSFLFLALWGA